MALDLFASLASLSEGDLQWYDNLSDEDKKAAAPFVLARWMTGTSDRAQLVRLNTFVNPYIFSLGSEKALLFKLLAAASTGNTRRYNWIKAPGGKKALKKKVEVIQQFYDISTREATLYVPLVSDEEYLEMGESLGWDADELKKLKAEFVKDGPGITEKSSGVKKKRS